ncbi:MAG: antitoxin CptB [Gammaproteobacteria bacterium]|jgi:antitoxin CptB
MSEISRLRWLCRRGMKELDVLMTKYLDDHYENASAQEQNHFKTLLAMHDPDLFALILRRAPAESMQLEKFTDQIRNLSGQARPD